MALRITEQWKSGDGNSGQNASDTYTAIVVGTPEDGIDSVSAVVAFAMSEFGAVSELGNVLSDFNRERLSPNVWRVSAYYRSPEDNRQTNDASFSFSTGGGTQHINYSRKTVKTYAAKGTVTTASSSTLKTFTPPNFRGAINVAPDKSIGGVDVNVPSFNFKTTHFMSPSAMTTDYVNDLKASTASVNSDHVSINVDGIVQDFAPGELLLLGADGSKRKGFGDWELGLSWASSPNITGLSIGDDGSGAGNPAVTDIQKRGFDYLWVYFGDQTVDGNAPVLVRPIQAVYIEQIYAYAPLSGLIPPSSFGATNIPPWTQPISSGSPGSGLFGLR